MSSLFFISFAGKLWNGPLFIVLCLNVFTEELNDDLRINFFLLLFEKTLVCLS